MITREDYERLYRETIYAQAPRSWFDEKGKIRLWPNNAWKRRLMFVVELYRTLKAKPPIVDIACGGQIPKKILGTHFDIKVLGVDFAREANPDMVDDARSLMFVDREFHLFTCFDMLEHIYRSDLSKVFDNLRRCFEFGGVFTIAYRPEAKQYGQKEQLHVTLEEPEWWGEQLCQVWPYVIHVGKKLWIVSHECIGHWKPIELLQATYKKRIFDGVWIEGTRIR